MRKKMTPGPVGWVGLVGRPWEPLAYIVVPNYTQTPNKQACIVCESGLDWYGWADATS